MAIWAFIFKMFLNISTFSQIAFFPLSNSNTFSPFLFLSALSPCLLIKSQIIWWWWKGKDS